MPSNATIDVILDGVRTRLPSVTDDQIKLELFNVVDEFAREVLVVAAPTNVDGDPASWLDSSLWVKSYQPLLEGVLARLYAQIGKPWASAELAKFHLERYSVLASLVRTDAAATPATVYQRLLNAVRIQLPMAREAAVIMAAFAVANKVRLDALRLTPLVDANTTPSGWLPSDKWDDAYQAMLYGTLARLQMQVGQPWSAPDIAKANQALFIEELLLLRGEQAEAASRDLSKLMDRARVSLPGARDNLIQLELFATVDEFFKLTNCWYEDVDFGVVSGTRSYLVTPTGVAKIVRLIGVVNSDERPQWAVMPTPGEIQLSTDPSVAQIFTARLALTISDPVMRDGYPEFPQWAYDKHSETVLSGLLGRMMSQPAKPYTNMQLSVYHMRRFRDGIARAKVEAMHQNVYRAQSWRFPQTFARRKGH